MTLDERTDGQAFASCAAAAAASPSDKKQSAAHTRPVAERGGEGGTCFNSRAIPSQTQRTHRTQHKLLAHVALRAMRALRLAGKHAFSSRNTLRSGYGTYDTIKRELFLHNAHSYFTQKPTKSTVPIQKLKVGK